MRQSDTSFHIAGIVVFKAANHLASSKFADRKHHMDVQEPQYVRGRSCFWPTSYYHLRPEERLDWWTLLKCVTAAAQSPQSSPD